MKEDLSRPLYADCKKQKGYGYFWSEPVISRERIYEFADRRLLVTGWVLIMIAIGVIGCLNPFWCRHLRFLEVPMICLVLIIIAEFFYTRKFVYRFGRFRVMWADAERHPDEEASSRCDKYGIFLNNEENLKSEKRSQRAFLVLFAGIIAAVLLYCFLWIGTSYTRVLSWHKGELEEAWQIAQKYDYVAADVLCRGADVRGKTESEWDISDQDRRRIWEICGSLQSEYVYKIFIFKDSGYFEVGIHTIFGYSKLIRDEDADASQVKHIFGADTVVQLDEHWFYVRMDDGRFFN